MGNGFLDPPLYQAHIQVVPSLNLKLSIKFRVFNWIYTSWVLYNTANDPQPQMIPRPQMIPKMDRKWSSTASDPQSGPQMIPKEK